MSEMISKWLENAAKRHDSRPWPRIECPDGFCVSVQAGQYLYCSPRHDNGAWYEVELGFPTEKVEAWMPYIDGYDSDPTDTVYGYVPIDLVEAELVRHGWVYPEPTEQEAQD
jgi:hypothetical protein